MGKCELCEGGVCKKDIRVSFCPKCKSRSVKYVFEFGNLFGIVPKMRCRDCEFEAVSFPVLVTTEEKLRTSIEKMKAKVVKKNVKTRNSVPSKKETKVSIRSGKKKAVKRK